MKILVTGAAGFIGSNLAKRLVQEGHNVTAADTFLSSGFQNLIDFEGDVLTLEHRLDIHSIRDLAERYGKFDVIFHQAAITGVIAKDGSASAGEDVHGFLRNNIEQFRQILDFAVDTQARVVWASSCSVYGRNPPPMRESQPYDPLNVYAFTKVQQERLAKIYQSRLSQPIVGLRYSNVYGPGEAHKGKLASMIYQLAVQIRNGQRPRVFEHGQQRRDFVYIEDVVEANLLAMRSRVSGNFNVGAGKSWSFNEIIANLNRVLKTNLEPEYFKNPYNFTQDWTETDLTQARQHLGYTPRYDLSEGIDKYYASGKLGV
jgi:ADP-L-glycero-D-manno-heptose 6-epimerase